MASRDISAVVQAISGGKETLKRALALIALPPYLTDSIAIKLAELELEEARSAEGLIVVLHFTGITVGFNGEWRLDTDIRDQLTIHRSKLNGQEGRAHHLLLDLRSEHLNGGDVGPLPRYLVSEPGQCYHATAINVDRGLNCYRAAWKPENSPEQWLLGTLAEDQQAQGVIPIGAVEPSFFRAMSLELEGDWEAAESYFNRVARSELLTWYVGMACHHLAIIRFRKHHDLVEARKLLERATEIASSIGDLKLRAFALNTLGGVLRAMGDEQGAVKALRESLELGERLDLTRHRAEVYNSLGSALRAIGMAEEAEQAFGKSLELGELLNDRRHLIQVLTSLGAIKRRLGSLDEAVGTLEEARRMAEIEKRPRLLAVVLNVLGSAYRAQGAFPEATACLVESLRIGREIGDKRHLSHVLQSLEQLAEEVVARGLGLRRSGALSQAAKGLAEAAEAFENLGDSEGLVRVLNALAAARRAGGDLAGAENALRKGIEVAQRERLEKSVPHLLVTRAGVLSDAGDFEGAVEILEEAVNRASDLGDLRQVSISRYALAEVLRRAGREEKAADQISLGIDAALGGHALNLVRRFGKVASEMSLDLSQAARDAQLEGDAGTATRALETALTLVEKVGDVFSEIRIRNTLAAVLRRQGRLNQAAEHLEIGLRLAQATGNRRLELLVENTRAATYRDQGQLGQAIEILGRARAVARRGDFWRELVFLDNTLASVLNETGDTEGAVQVLKEAVSLAEENDDRTLLEQSLRSLLSIADDLTTGGLELRRQGEVEEAESAFQRVVDVLRDLPFTEARGYAENSLAALKRERGEPAQAQEVVERALQDLERSSVLSRNNKLKSFLLNTLTAVLRDRGDLDGALRTGELANDASSQVADKRVAISVRLTLASVHRRRGAWGQVIKEFRLIREISEHELVHLDTQVLLKMANFRREFGDLEGAAKDLLDAAKQADVSGGYRAGNIWFTLAGVRRQLGDLQGSLDALNAAEHSRDIAQNPRRLCMVLNTRAAVYRELDDLADARATAERSLVYAKETGIDNAVAMSLNTLAAVLRDMGQLKRAIEVYNEILALCNTRDVKLVDAAAVRESQRQLEKVVRAIEDRPDASSEVLGKYFRGLGQGLAQIGEVFAARNSLRRALSYGLPTGSERSARATLGNVLFRLKSYEEAIQEYERVLKMGWDGSPLRANYARSLFAIGRDFTIVEEQFKKSLALDEENKNGFARSWYALALADQEGREEDAERLALEGVQVQPNHAAILTNYARVLIRLGGEERLQLAREALKTAIETAPEGFHWPWLMLLELQE